MEKIVQKPYTDIQLIWFCQLMEDDVVTLVDNSNILKTLNTRNNKRNKISF